MKYRLVSLSYVKYPVFKTPPPRLRRATPLQEEGFSLRGRGVCGSMGAMCRDGHCPPVKRYIYLSQAGSCQTGQRVLQWHRISGGGTGNQPGPPPLVGGSAPLRGNFGLPFWSHFLSSEIYGCAYLEEDQEKLIGALSDKELREVLDELYLDDTVDLIEDMPANLVSRRWPPPP